MNGSSLQHVRHPGWLLGIIALVFAGAGLVPASAGAFFSASGPEPEGWFWYDMPPKPVKPEPKQKPKPKPPTIANRPAKRPRKTQSNPDQGPPVFSVAWIRKNLKKYRNRAINNPTRKNILAFLSLQRVMLDKAQAFSDAMEAVVKTTPVLDESTRRPLNAMGAKLANQRANRARDRAMRWLADRVGIWYFYSSDCAACAPQASQLHAIQQIYDWTITAIAMDGKAPPPRKLERVRIDTGQAGRLGINTPLALVLVNPRTREVVPLSHSLLTRTEIVGRILLAAHTAGWLPDQLYNRTRPMRANRTFTHRISNRHTYNTPVPVQPGRVLRRLGLEETIHLSGAR